MYYIKINKLDTMYLYIHKCIFSVHALNIYYFVPCLTDVVILFAVVSLHNRLRYSSYSINVSLHTYLYHAHNLE